MVSSTHLPPPAMMDSVAVRALATHMLCWSCAMYFCAAPSSENDHGSMNLDSNTAPVPSTIPSKVAAKNRMTGCCTRRWTAVTAWSRAHRVWDACFKSRRRRLSGAQALALNRLQNDACRSGSPETRQARKPRFAPMQACQDPTDP